MSQEKGHHDSLRQNMQAFGKISWLLRGMQSECMDRGLPEHISHNTKRIIRVTVQYGKNLMIEGRSLKWGPKI